MSKTKTKRVVASFLLLCAMSGTSVLAAMPDGWNEGSDLAGNAGWLDQDNTVTIDKESFEPSGSPFPSASDKAPFFIDNNTASSINVNFSAGNLTIQDYVNNTTNGGAMSFGTAIDQTAESGAHNITVSGISQIINNSVTATDANGGGVYNNANLTFSGSTTFSGNEAAANGGAIYNDASGIVTINGGSFTGNSAGSQGGAIYNAGKVTLDSTNSKITFSNNTTGSRFNPESNDVYLADNGSLELTGTNDISFGGSIEGESSTAITSTASNLILKGDNSNFAGSFTQTSGKTTVNDQFFGGTNNIEGGQLILADGSTLDGENILTGDASITINNGTKYENGTSVAINSADAQLNLVNNETGDNAMTIDGLEITGTQGTINKTGNGILNINEDQNFTGNYVQQGGTVNVSSKFFGGNNSINSGTLNLSNGAELVSGSTTNLGNSSTNPTSATLNVDGSTIAGAVVANVNSQINLSNNATVSNTITLHDASDININTNSVSDIALNGSITSDGTNNTITLTQGNLNIGASQSGFAGQFIQYGGKTTVNTGTLFGGKNTINGGSVVLNAADAIVSTSTVQLANGSDITVAANTTMSRNVSGSGEIKLGTDGVTLTLLNDQSVFNGTYTQTAGSLVIGDGTNQTTSFSGTNAISGGSVTVKNNATLQGRNNVSGGSVTMEDGSILEGSNTFSNAAQLIINSVATDNADSITLKDTSSMTLLGANDFTLKTGVTGESTASILNNLTEDLTIAGNNSGFGGSYTQSSSTTKVNSGAAFFGGINAINGGVLEMLAGSTLAGQNTIESGAELIIHNAVSDAENTTIILKSGSELTINPAQGTSVKLSDYQITADNGSIINKTGAGEMVVNADNTITTGGNYKGSFNQDAGTTTVSTKFFAGTNTITGGTINFIDGSTLLGTNKITDAAINLNGTSQIGDSTTTIALGSGGVLNFAGTGTVESGNAQTLTQSISGVNSAFGEITKTGTGELVINADQSGFEGNFTQSAGTTTVENGSLFGGANKIEHGIVNMNDNSSLASGSTMEMGEGTGLNIKNSGADHSAATNNIPGKTDNATVLSGTISSAVAEAGTITVSGENTYLVVDADMSGFTGGFTQSLGATTEVTENGIFFAGKNDINDGHFIFRDGAQLSNDVNINSKDVVLAFGDGTKEYKIEEGNKVYYYDDDGNRSDNAFIMNNVTITGTLYGGEGEYKIKDTDFGTNGGFASTADYNIVKQDDGSETVVNMIQGSVVQDGAHLDVGEETVLNITANNMERDAQSKSQDGTFGADLTGAGTINVSNTNDKDHALIFVSDNSGFKGRFNHEGGSIRFIGNGVDNAAANFFNGTNNITAGNVIFDANSVVMGNNKLSDGAYFEFKDGSSIDDSENNKATLDLTNGGQIDITNETLGFDLNVGVIDPNGNGFINKTAGGALTISDNQSQYKGNFVQSGGGITTVSDGKSFFGGTNNINAGVVDLRGNTDDSKIGAILAGSNTISADGKMIIGDFTDTTSQLTSPVIVNTGFDTDTGLGTNDEYGLNLHTTDDKQTNLEVAFEIASGDDNLGKVTHTGDGALNLRNAGTSDNFAGFNGIFEQTSTGITNVFGNSFKNNHIKNGVLNMKAGSTLVDGSTTLEAGATLNIGTLENDTTVNPEEFNDNSKVTIASDIKGAGDVNISQGKVTITGTSDNSGFNGEYRQTGDSVVEAKANSTFFGGINNLIEKGKLLFRKDAKLAKNSTVELSGNTAEPQNDTDRPVEKAVLDLDGRENAVFNGSNELTLAGESAEGAKFVFTDGILQNALLHGTQNIGSAADETKDEMITLGAGSGFASDAVVTINGVSEGRAPEVALASGSIAADGSKAQIGENGVLYLVSEGLDYYTITTGDGFIGVGKDAREENAPNINIYNDQSGFKGEYYQDAGRVTVKEGATFFAGDSANDKNIVITGNLDNGTNGELYLEKGSFIGGDILHVNNAAEQEADQGAFSPHGRVYIADKIYTQDGIELTDINELMKGDLYYNTKYDENGNLLVDELKNIKINNAGLVLANGTVFDGSQGVTEFNKQNNGVVDIGFADGAGVNGDIRLGDETMLSYGDNAFIKDDSTLEMSDSAVLNFMNENTTLNYNPEIIGGGSIYKEGLAITNVSSAIDMTGELKVSEGTLNFTNKDKVIFNKGDSNPRQTGSATIGSDSSSANLSIVANQTVFGGDVIANAKNDTQSVLALAGKNTEIGGNLSTTNTAVSIFGNTTVGGNFNIDGNTSLNLAGNYANTIDVAGDLILGSELKDNKLPVSFDYDPHRDAMDSIIVDSFVNPSDSPLLITGINFVTSPVDRTFSLDADRLIQQRNPQDQPYYDPTNFYANTAMGRYFLSNGVGGPDFSGTLVHLNPQQYRGQVATIASWQNQLLINNLLFDHMDIVTRQLMDEEKTANKYAASIPQFAPYQYDLKGGSLWYKAYGNFETLSMTKGLNVGNNAYGALIGADFPLIKLKHGWNIVPTAYIGYNGAHQHFNGVSMYQNGAQLGVMGTAYKGDFITSLLAYGGGYGNDMSMRGEYGSGSDNTGNWFAGVASKTAYNFHLPADFIFQPTVMAAYNAFGSQNWGSDFGVMSMSSGMLNGINVAPGFNLIWQKKSFNIYLTAQMVYNIMGGVDGRAGNIELGYVRMRHSYFEYGLGISKNFKDRFGGFLQFVIRNGGRTGIGFSGGIQIKLGK